MKFRGRRFKTNCIVYLSGIMMTLSFLTFMIYVRNKMIWNNVDIKTRIQMSWFPSMTTRQLDRCPVRPKNSARPINVTTDVNNLTVTEDQSGDITRGGRYKPSTCISRHRVAVIVPYRDRETHLKLFLNHMHPFLQRQHLDYGIFVIESIPGIRFNRGLLMNVGFIEASKLYEYDCFIVHDVDMLPENDGINYSCDQSPAHFSHAISTRKYRLPYANYFGGVCAISKKHFGIINGFSNIYFGWGGEDDDIRGRLTYHNLTITRLSSKVGRFVMLKHKKAKANPDKFRLFKTMKKRHLTDGLNSLKYQIKKHEFKRLYTWILVSANETKTLESEQIHKEAFKHSETVKRNNTVNRKPGKATS